jgi:hypothetical protein
MIPQDLWDYWHSVATGANDDYDGDGGRTAAR